MDAALTTTGLNEALADRYVIERELGSGGMATVYLARDVRHQRRVALKVLHPELAAVIGGERFLAEITTTAHLQHPGILPLFDSGEAAGQLFYVMPFVDGESLRARLDRERQLPVADAVRIASEVGDALAYAHDHGVVHRDIKPENILLQTGRPIVADFGIALAVQHAGAGRLTQTGLSLGTPQYMSPEQAAGERTVDGRTDQYALAAVLYEMLAGVPPFTAASTQALIAKLMSEAPPPLSNQRKSIPAHVERAVLQALEKLAADRFATTRDFVRALSADVASPEARRATRATTGRWRWMAVAAATLVAGAAIGAGVDRAVRPAVSAPPSTPIRFTIDMEPGQSLTGVCCGNIFVVSPNGQRVAYQAVDPDSIARIHIRELDGVTSRSLSDTDNGRELFFSPDGNRLGFVSGRTVRFADLRSGTVRTVAELPATGFSGGGTWTDDDRIIYAVGNHMLVVPAGGGTLADLFHVDSAGGQWQVVGPHFVHEANALLYSVQTVGSEARLHIRWLASGKTKEIGFGVAPSYVSAGGWLLVARPDGTVEARRFDPSRGDTLSPARRVLTGVTMRSPVFLYAEYAASANGTVVTTSRDLYSSNTVGALHLVSEKGPDEVHQIPFRSNRVFAPRFSPDGNRIAAGTFDAQTRLLTALIYDPQRRAASNLSQGGDVSAVDWTADGDSVVLVNTSGTVQIQSRDGSAPRQIGRLHGWANIARLDARATSGWMVFEGDAGGSLDIGVMHRDSVEHARKLIASPAAEGWPRLSPDGHRIAFTVIENGRASVQVASFPSLADRTVISNAVGSEPRWSRDGTLFYLDVTRHVVVVPTPSSGQRAAARTLGLVIPTSRGWDVDPAGKRFVYATEPNAAGPARLLVTVNALAENAIEPSSRGAGRP